MFDFKVFWDFHVLSFLLTSSLIPLRSENILRIISILFNVLRFIFWPRIQSVLVDDSCALEYNVFSIVQLCYINVNLILLVDVAVQVFCIFAKFLSTSSINYWKESAEVFNYNCIFVYFPFSSVIFTSCILKLWS